MTRLKKAGILLLILLICFMNMPVSGAESLRDCHRVTNKASVTTQKNKSQVKLWHVETAHPAVTEEINGIAQAWADELSPDLPGCGDPLQPDRTDLAELSGAGQDNLPPEADGPAVYDPDL